MRWFNSFPVHQHLEHVLFDCFGPWFTLITWDQWICGTRGQCCTISQSCQTTFILSHDAAGQFIYLMIDGCLSHLEMWNRVSGLVRSPCTWSRNLQIYFGDTAHKSLVYPSLIAKTHPRHFDGAPLIKMLFAILWSPLLTRIASRPCNAAGVQRCIVMPGCPTAPIPFKALPSGWHQLGCCSKRCPFFSVIKCGLCIEVSKAPEA